MIVSLRVAGLVAALTSIGMAQRAAAVEYAIQRFDTLPNGQLPIPADIDNFGSIAGHFLSSGVSTGFVLDTSGGFVTFNSPGRTSTQPRGMNNIGQVVGMVSDPSLDAPSAFLRQPNGDLLEFEVPSDLSFVANDINDLGQIVGTRRFTDGRADVFVREPDGAMHYFDLTTDEPETAVGINNRGQVTGLFDIYGYILEINTGEVTPFKPKFGYVVPDGINNDGDVVGHWDEGDDGNKGFVYTSNGNYRLFNGSFPGLEETNPAGINDLDQIVGTYYYETGQGLSQSGFIATPVPEPSSFALLGVAIAAAFVADGRPHAAYENLPLKLLWNRKRRILLESSPGAIAVASIPHLFCTTVPTQSEASVAQESARSLLQLVAANDAKECVSIAVGKSTDAVPVPLAALRLLADVLIEMGKGNAVMVLPSQSELSIQEAADLLHVSTPFLSQELDRGAIPFHDVGSNRCVVLQDLVAYQQRKRELRLQMLDQLTEQAQELNMGY